ncbi:MAG: tRNA (adenosine(37)-N6)-threonylcarbamoyltransferase complex ATPase subunit type 1 TsaE [Kineosporiaceae bacterium]
MTSTPTPEEPHVNGAHRAESLPHADAVDAPSVEVDVVVPTSRDMADLGHYLASAVRAGDLLVLTGDLGAGKTTLTRGLGAGLGVRGEVTSPTFVIARVHPAGTGTTPLVHVDAYRLGSLAEVDDLDLDASLEESVTVVEWGEGLVEDLAAARLEIRITRPVGGAGPDRVVDGDEPRTVHLRGFGQRWAGLDLPGAR